MGPVSSCPYYGKLETRNQWWGWLAKRSHNCRSLRIKELLSGLTHHFAVVQITEEEEKPISSLIVAQAEKLLRSVSLTGLTYTYRLLQDQACYLIGAIVGIHYLK